MSPRGRRLIAASAFSAAVILTSPVMGQIRGLLRSAFPVYFVMIVGASVAAAVGAAIVTAVVRIKEFQAARYAAMAAALAIGIAYGLASRTGIADQDAVERFHFVEYGLITILFYGAWRENGDASSFCLPILTAVVVATLDEWFQWFVPVRVGEIRDVLLDVVAICCGLLLGAAIAPPSVFSKRLRPQSTVSICVAGAAATLALAAFVSTVHFGYLVRLETFPDTLFPSHYTAARLDALAADRAARWQTDPPLILKRFSQEDQYMDEGLWHIRRRNTYWAADNYLGAWNENLILERFYSPLLDTKSYALPASERWPAEQRAAAAASTAKANQHSPFVSDAEPYPVLLWSKHLFWSAVGCGVLGLLLITYSQRKSYGVARPS